VSVAERDGAGAAVGAPATYRSLFGDREFRALWLGQAISLTGDQLARVAIAYLVYQQTRSALVTALIYALTFLPWLVGGPLLGGLADRYPRRTVMIVCQLLNAGLVAVMAVPWLPLAALAGLLFVVVLLESPFLSARAALLADVLPDDRYVLASALGQLLIQGSQVLGFAVGGALVLALGPRTALLVDAATFLCAAGMVARFVGARPAPASRHASGAWRRIREGAVVVFGDAWLRRLVLLAWLSAFWVVPEGLAAPYTGGSATAVGLMLAAQPTGAVCGGLVLSRLVWPATRLRLMVPLAAVSCLPLAAFAAPIPLAAALGLLVLSGVGTAYNLPANAAFMQSLPPERRAQAFGLAGSGIVALQGLAIVLAGAIADTVGPGLVIGAAGALGLASALLLSGAARPAAAAIRRACRRRVGVFAGRRRRSAIDWHALTAGAPAWERCSPAGTSDPDAPRDSPGAAGHRSEARSDS
jgi:MFS family permease